MKVIISDIANEHAESVKAALLLGDPDLQTSEVKIRIGNTVETDLEYAMQNGAVLLIRSTEGALSNLDIANQYYEKGGILTCMPAGGNTGVLEFTESIPQSLCVTGAGDVENETAYHIEFFANDPITSETVPDEQDNNEYANAYVAGQLLYVRDRMKLDWEETRQIARATASGGGVWHIVNGYGSINVEHALDYYRQKYENRLVKYLPTFVDTSGEIIGGFLYALSKSLERLGEGTRILRKCWHVGKGLLMTAKEFILFHNKIDEITLQRRLEMRYDILTARGSELGISQDLSHLLGDGLDHADFYGIDECGWIVDVNYPGIDFENVVDLNKLIVIHYYGNEVEIDNYEDTIMRYLIPLDILVLYYDLSHILLSEDGDKLLYEDGGLRRLETYKGLLKSSY